MDKYALKCQRCCLGDSRSGHLPEGEAGNCFYWGRWASVGGRGEGFRGWCRKPGPSSCAMLLGVQVAELQGATVISTWECPGGRRLAWRPSGVLTQGLEPGQGGLLGRVVLQTLLVGGPSGPRGVGSSWGLGVYVPPRTRVREHLSRCREIRSLPCQASCPRETPPPHLAGWLEAQWEGGAHMDIIQKRQASLGPGGWGTGDRPRWPSNRDCPQSSGAPLRTRVLLLREALTSRADTRGCLALSRWSLSVWAPAGWHLSLSFPIDLR